MSILVDTSVWSLSLRRHRHDLNPRERAIVFHCRDLAIAGETCLIAPIIQETLSGIAVTKTFELVREQLFQIEELALTLEIYVLAAEFYNSCRTAGVSPGNIDMTICAAAHTHAASIFTTDPDFARYAKHLPITLHTF